jgi:hypothetical protein
MTIDVFQNQIITRLLGILPVKLKDIQHITSDIENITVYTPSKSYIINIVEEDRTLDDDINIALNL